MVSYKERLYGHVKEILFESNQFMDQKEEEKGFSYAPNKRDPGGGQIDLRRKKTP